MMWLKRMEKIDQANQRKNAKYEEVCDLAETQQEILLKQLSTLEALREREAIKTRLYEAKSLHNKIFSKRKFYTLRMMESTSVTDHINTLNTLFSQLTSMEHNIETGECAEILFQSLSDFYDQLIINLTNNIEILVFDDIAAAVLKEESRRKNKENRMENSQQAEALTMTREINGTWP